ncbi:MAG: dihydrodipicolinate synthase family protein [Gemmataceae bacterium]
MVPHTIDPITLIRPRRKITGISAILLPFTTDGKVDWNAFTTHVARTSDAGLTPAVNMDTGYANLIDEATREEALRRTRETLDMRPFVAGAYVRDTPTSAFDLAAYGKQIEAIRTYRGTPVIFQSFGLTQQPDHKIVESYAQFAEYCDEFIAFELGQMFVPFGKIYSLDVYRGLLGIPQCTGAKHSSLHREPEWQRLVLRDEVRPDFKVYTGNDLAIDMVMYGSDYLLGLSTFAPDLFARRDAFWADGNTSFFELNDALQYLGFFVFREPVPAYKHSAAMFLHMRGWIESDRTHPGSPERPASDKEVLRGIFRQLELTVDN